MIRNGNHTKYLYYPYSKLFSLTYTLICIRTIEKHEWKTKQKLTVQVLRLSLALVYARCHLRTHTKDNNNLSVLYSFFSSIHYALHRIHQGQNFLSNFIFRVNNFTWSINNIILDKNKKNKTFNQNPINIHIARKNHEKGTFRSPYLRNIENIEVPYFFNTSSKAYLSLAQQLIKTQFFYFCVSCVTL